MLKTLFMISIMGFLLYALVEFFGEPNTVNNPVKPISIFTNKIDDVVRASEKWSVVKSGDCYAYRIGT